MTRKLKVHNLVLDLDKWEAYRGGRIIDLSFTEFNILKFLMENKGKVCGRQEIISNVFATHPHPNTIDVYISYLRRKIDKGFKKKLIQTISKVGYKITDK